MVWTGGSGPRCYRVNKADKKHFHGCDKDQVLIGFLNLDSQDWSLAILPVYRPAPNSPVVSSPKTQVRHGSIAVLIR